MMLSAVQQVLDDKDFKIKSAVAIKAHHVAAKLMEWSSEKENKGILTKFSDELIPKLEEVFVGTVGSTGSRQVMEIFFHITLIIRLL